ncbi:MAG: winged helix-turn-helix transcriptional regulator [Anaerolineae bacterium]|nr:winged helix-turn-helix transcriptional regulator [Anaerolineae bacterium]
MLHQKSVKKQLQVGNLILDLEKTTLTKGKTAFHLTPKETRLMALLMDNAGQIVSRDQMMKEVWHTNGLGDSRTLDVHIRWLRQKVEDNPNIPEYILTRRNLGYELRVKD